MPITIYQKKSRIKLRLFFLKIIIRKIIIFKLLQIVKSFLDSIIIIKKSCNLR